MKFIKTTNKIICFLAVFLFFNTSIFIFAQTEESEKSSDSSSSSEEDLNLPDVTTVISGKVLQAGKNSVPDFTDILPDSDTSATVLPVLSDSSLPDMDTPAKVSSDTVDAGQTIYAEGLVGAGLQGSFTGDFSIYRSEGQSPFRLSFNHDRSTGYLNNNLSDGFFDSTTALSGEKDIVNDATKIVFSGFYKTTDNGLQSNSDSFYDMTRQVVNGNILFDWSLPENFSLHARTDTNFYQRYAGLTGTGSYEAYQKQFSIFDIAPEVKLSWTKQEFSAEFSANYLYEGNVGDKDTITGYEGTLLNQYLNRGNFSLNAVWKTDDLEVFGTAACVIGNETGENNILFPFKLGFKSKFDTNFSERALSIKAEGGLDSFTPSCKELENYLYTSLSFIPSEVSDWYGNLQIKVPVKNMFTFESNAGYRQTAFGNGIWEADYDTSTSSGIYGFNQVSRTDFFTNTTGTFSYSMFTVSLGWKSHWIYIPVKEYGHILKLSMAMQPENSNYGADSSVSFMFGNTTEYVPIVDLSVFYRLISSLRLELQCNDIVKLISNKPRTYCGNYISKSGDIKLLVKFFF